MARNRLAVLLGENGSEDGVQIALDGMLTALNPRTQLSEDCHYPHGRGFLLLVL